MVRAGASVLHPPTPATFVTAVYDNGPDSLLGGRGRGIGVFLPSLINVAHLGGRLVIFCAPEQESLVRETVSPHAPFLRVVPFPLSAFEHFASFVEWKRSYMHEVVTNDRNEVLCYLKSYFVQRAIESGLCVTDHCFWIDAGLSHHGIFPERVGGVELGVAHPAAHYFPHNPRNIFTPSLGRAIVQAPAPGTVLFCGSASPAGSIEARDDARVAAALDDPTRVARLPDLHLAGGLFGGRAKDVSALHGSFRSYLATCITRGVRTLEEQIFSTIYAQEPERFTVLRFGTWRFHSPGERTSYLTEEGDSFYKIFQRLLAPGAGSAGPSLPPLGSSPLLP